MSPRTSASGFVRLAAALLAVAVVATLTACTMPRLRATSDFAAVTVSVGGYGLCENFAVYQVDFAEATLSTSDQCPGSEPSLLPLDADQVTAFAKSLNQVGVRWWGERYASDSVMDGVGYNVTVEYASGETRETYVYYRYPPGWKKFVAAAGAVGMEL